MLPVGISEIVTYTSRITLACKGFVYLSVYLQKYWFGTTSGGLHNSINDSDTGYSDLYQLSHLPFSILRIDKFLVDDIGKNSRSEVVVTAIVQMVVHSSMC